MTLEPLRTFVCLFNITKFDLEFYKYTYALGFGINKGSTKVQIKTVLTLRTLNEHFKTRS